jgi:hypothetical protein
MVRVAIDGFPGIKVAGACGTPFTVKVNVPEGRLEPALSAVTVAVNCSGLKAKGLGVAGETDEVVPPLVRVMVTGDEVEPP